MSLWYALLDAQPWEMLHWDFMKNAFLAVLLMAPLFGLTSTMIVTGRMSFFSDALGHAAFTGIAIGAICGLASPTWAAVLFALGFALLFSFVRSRSHQTADTLIGVFSSTAVALGIFIATAGGGSFTKYNKYLIGDILSVTPGEIGMLALVLLAVVVTLAISWVGLLILNSLLVLPAAAARNVSRNLKQYHSFSVLFALAAGIGGLTASYYLGASAGASISLTLAVIFAVSLCFRKARA